MANQSAISPQYLGNFTCIGSDCEDTCCSGWTVSVNKSAFKKLKNSSNLDVASSVKKHFKITAEPSDIAYASIQLAASGYCPLLDADSMCSIQRKLDHSFLPRTCADFPRYYFRVADKTEVLGTLACPELARKCLLDVNAFNTITVEIPFTPNQKPPYRGGFNFGAKLHGNPIQRNFELIREVVIQTLQRKDYFIWQRLMIIGLLVNKLNALNEIKDIPGSPESQQNDALVGFELERMWEMLGTDTTKQQLNELTNRLSDALIQQALLKELTEERLKFNGEQFGGVKFATFLICIADAFQGIGYSEADPVGTAKRFKEAESTWFNPFIEKNHQISANFITNLVLTEMFPSNSRKSLVRQWNEIMLRYAMVRFYLIGMAGKHKEAFGNEHCVKLIYSFSREILHSNSFLDHMFTQLEKADLMNLATMSILVKD
jgi:lysine-N-methylase